MNVKRLIPTFHARTVRVLNAWRPEGVGMYEPAGSHSSSSNTMLMPIPSARMHTHNQLSMARTRLMPSHGCHALHWTFSVTASSTMTWVRCQALV